MLSVNGISLFYGDRALFKNISFVVNPKDRVGLVGKNGVGKSTLLNIVNGQRKPDEGSVTSPDGYTIGYLPQEIKIVSNKSILEETLTVFDEVERLGKEIESISKELETRTDYESDEYHNLIVRLTEKHERLNIIGSAKNESQAEKVLKGLGFLQEDLSKPLGNFSGGWQMRVELAKLLIKMPDLLLLDEPTNHLDIESIIWLEEFFQGYPGGIMMVSHDKMFLDNVTNRTIEIVGGKIYDIKASYSKFLNIRQERIDIQQSAFDNQQRYIAQQERFIERFKAKNSKAKQAQSRVKQLEKIEIIELDDTDTSSINFRFPSAPRSGLAVLSAEHLYKSYDDKKVLNNLNLLIERGEKVAFVGKNGQGKTTFVKLITKQEKHQQGKLEIGANVEIGYYAQQQENTLDENLTVYETISNHATDEWRNETRIRTLLGAFLFRNDEIDKKVKVLSGGEKSRLAIAKLLLRPINLLILDEPTNHLDIASKEILKKALINFDGTLIVVSHDREFLRGLNKKTIEFTNGSIREHLGDIDYFLEKHKAETVRDFERTKPLPKQENTPKTESKNAAENKDRKDQEKEIKQLKSAIAKSEKTIETLEKEIQNRDASLANPEQYKELINNKAWFEEYNACREKLDAEFKNWEDIGSKLLQLESE